MFVKGDDAERRSVHGTYCMNARILCWTEWIFVAYWMTITIDALSGN